MQRRNFMEAVAAAASVRWEKSEYDIENVDEWEPLQGGIYPTGEVTPERVLSSSEGKHAAISFHDEDFAERVAEVTYNDRGVSLSIEGNGEEDVHAGALGVLTTDQARELGAILYQAAEELDRRREAENEEN